jgi:hypothetical protein
MESCREKRSTKTDVRRLSWNRARERDRRVRVVEDRDIIPKCEDSRVISGQPMRLRMISSKYCKFLQVCEHSVHLSGDSL